MSIYRMRTQFGGALKILLGLIAFGFLVGGIFSFGPSQFRRQDKQKGGTGEVIARVNGIEITRGEFEAMVDPVLESYKRQGIRSYLQAAEIRAMQLQSVIGQLSVLAAAQAEKVDVSDSKVNEEVDKQVTRILNDSRQVVLGKLSKKQLKMDPRDDPDFAEQLRSIDSSVAHQEEIAKSRISTSAIKAELAQKGLEDKIRSTVKDVSDAEAKASYNVYKTDVVVVGGMGLPKDQIADYAKKVAGEIKGGTDPAKLPKNDKIQTSAQKADITSDNLTRMPALDKAMAKMKPGDVETVENPPYGWFVIRLNAMESKMPAGISQAKLKARAAEVKKARQEAAVFAFKNDLGKKMKIEILDPELQGYNYLSKMQQGFVNPADAKKNIGLAIGAFERARKARPENYYATAKLVQLLSMEGKYKEAADILYPMLEGKTATVEGSDLRILLGDALMKTGEKDKALDQFKKGSDAAMYDEGAHQQLMSRFQQLGQPALADAEAATIVEIKQRKEELQKSQSRNAPAPSAPKTKE